jgi:hypothetical protein
MLSARPPTIEINAVATCDAHNQHAFTYVVAAGPVALAASLWNQPGTSRLSWTAEAGKTYFVRVKSADKNWAGLLGMAGTLAAEAASERAGPFDIDLADEAASQG